MMTNSMLKFPGITLSRVADADLPNYVAVADGAGDSTIALATAVAGILGITTEVGGKAGDTTDFVCAGMYPVRAGAAVTIGALVGVDAQGRAIPAAGGGLGKAYSAASAADEIIFVLLDLSA